jgi:hypothetical protein
VRRFLTLALLAVTATLAWADDPAARLAAERARQFERNRNLIDALVQSALHLAGEDDALKRADQCAGLAEQLGQEIRDAAHNHDTARISELSSHFQAMLEQGVAGNLLFAKKSVAAGSHLDQKMGDLRGRTADVIKNLEEEVRRATDADNRSELQGVLKAIHAGGDVVDRAGRKE